MNKLLVEQNKYDITYANASLDGAGTSRYYSLENSAKALFVVGVGGMASGNTAILQTMQATDKDGSGEKVITNNVATVTANENVQALTIQCDTVVEGNKVTVNGVEFEGVDAEPTGNEFVRDANDTTTATNLKNAINAHFGDYIVATSSTDTVTLQSNEDKTTITATGTADRFVIATTRALGLVELDESYLDAGFGHVALRVTTNASQSVNVAIVRGSNRYSVNQNVSALKADKEE